MDASSILASQIDCNAHILLKNNLRCQESCREICFVLVTFKGIRSIGAYMLY